MTSQDARPTPLRPLSRAVSVLEHLAVLGMMTFLSIAAIRPIWRISSGVPGAEDDAWMNVFHLWWMRRAFEFGLSPFFNPYLHHPSGAEMYWHTLAPIKHAWGIVLLPFLDIVTAYNVVLLLSFVLSGYTAWLLYRYLCERFCGRSWLASASGVVAACFFTFSPYHLAHANGQINLISIEGIPLFVLFYLRYQDSGIRKFAVFAALAALYTILSDYYYFAYLMIFVAIDMGLTLFRDGSVFSLEAIRHDRMRRGVIVICTSIAFVSPLLLALLLHAYPPPMNPFHGDSDYYLDLLGPLVPLSTSYLSVLVPPALRHAVLVTINSAITERGFFLGWTVLALSVFSVRKSLPYARRFFAIACVFLSFALGAHLSIMGTTALRIWIVCGLAVIAMIPLVRGPRRRFVREIFWGLIIIGVLDFLSPFTLDNAIVTLQIPMPYLFLKNLIPFYARGGIPVRFMLMVYLSLGACLAVAVTWLAQKKPFGLSANEVVLSVFLLLVLEFPGAAYKMVPFAPRPAAVIEQIRREPPEIAVMTDDNVLSELDVVLHEHPVSTARLSRIPKRELDELRRPVFDVLMYARSPEGLSPEEITEMRRYIRDNHFKYLIFHNEIPWMDRFVTEKLGGKALHNENWFHAYQLYD